MGFALQMDIISKQLLHTSLDNQLYHQLKYGRMLWVRMEINVCGERMILCSLNQARRKFYIELENHEPLKIQLFNIYFIAHLFFGVVIDSLTLHAVVSW